MSAWEKVTFSNSRGHKLAGLFYPADNKPEGPVVVVCHGFTGSKEGGGMAISMAEKIARSCGCSFFLFDFAGCGESEGKFEDLTLSGQIDDLNCAVNWCTARGLSPVITMGRSFGGTTVVAHGAQDPRVFAVCTWAAPVRLEELFSSIIVDDPGESGELVSISGDDGLIYLNKNFFRDLKQHDVRTYARQLSPRPLLIIHGNMDNVVPLEDGEILYRAAGEPKKMVIINGADHQFSRHHEEVWDTVCTWLTQIL